MTTIMEAEKAVVGSGFLDTDSIRRALDHVTPDDFEDTRLGRIFGLMVGHRSAGLAIDELTIAAAAKERGMVGIEPMHLFDLRAGTPTASNVAFYAKIVHEAAVRRRIRSAGLRFMQLADGAEPLAQTMQDARGEWEAVQSSVGTHMVAKTLGDVLDGSDEYDWLIPNLLERMDRVVITGGEGAGKTTFVRQLGVLAAAGLHPTLFHQIKPIRVLAVDAENTEKQWRRGTRSLALKARMAGSVDPALNLHLSCQPRIDITTDRDLGSIHRLIDEHEPDLLLIGPLYRLIPRAITSDDDAAPLLTALDSIRARGIAMVMEAHAGHATAKDGNRDLRPRGSSALMGWPEFGFGIALDHSEQPPLGQIIRWRGDRDERAWPITMRRGGAWPWADANPTATAAHIQRINERSPA